MLQGIKSVRAQVCRRGLFVFFLLSVGLSGRALCGEKRALYFQKPACFLKIQGPSEGMEKSNTLAGPFGGKTLPLR